MYAYPVVLAELSVPEECCGAGSSSQAPFPGDGFRPVFYQLSGGSMCRAETGECSVMNHVEDFFPGVGDYFSGYTVTEDFGRVPCQAPAVRIEGTDD